MQRMEFLSVSYPWLWLFPASFFCLSDLTRTLTRCWEWIMVDISGNSSPVDLSRVKQRPVPSSHGSLLRRIPGGYLAQIYKQSLLVIAKQGTSCSLHFRGKLHCAACLPALCSWHLSWPLYRINHWTKTCPSQLGLHSYILIWIFTDQWGYCFLGSTFVRMWSPHLHGSRSIRAWGQAVFSMQASFPSVFSFWCISAAVSSPEL